MLYMIRKSPESAHPRWLMRLSDEFVALSRRDPSLFPDLRSNDLLCASDYSGGTKEFPFYTMSFVIAPFCSMPIWDSLRSQVRIKHLPDRRSMSYKRLGDSMRSNALDGYLAAANEIKGTIFTFAIARDLDQIFCTKREAESMIAEPGSHLAGWKNKPFRKMVALSSLISFLVGVFIGKRRNVFWVTDDDDFTHSHEAMIVLAQWLRALRKQNMPWHQGKALVQAASRMENDRLEMYFQDFCSIPDLAAGAISEAWKHAFKDSFPEPDSPFLCDLSGICEKSKPIINWYHSPDSKLKKIHCMIGRVAGTASQFSVLVAPGYDFPTG